MYTETEVHNKLQKIYFIIVPLTELNFLMLKLDTVLYELLKWWLNQRFFSNVAFDIVQYIPHYVAQWLVPSRTESIKSLISGHTTNSKNAADSSTVVGSVTLRLRMELWPGMPAWSGWVETASSGDSWVSWQLSPNKGPRFKWKTRSETSRRPRMPSCAAVGCSKWSDLDREVHFFLFHKEQQLWFLWEQKVRTKVWYKVVVECVGTQLGLCPFWGLSEWLESVKILKTL